MTLAVLLRTVILLSPNDFVSIVHPFIFIFLFSTDLYLGRRAGERAAAAEEEGKKQTPLPPCSFTSYSLYCAMFSMPTYIARLCVCVCACVRARMACVYAHVCVYRQIIDFL